MNAQTPWLEGLTIGHVLQSTAQRFPERDALIFPQANLHLNYAQYAAAARDVAKGLLAMGIKPGEHVGVWATNLPEWVLLQYGAATVGIVLVTINPAYRPFELSYTITQSDLVALFLTDRFKTSDYYAIFREVCPQIEHAVNGKIHSPDFPKMRLAVSMTPNSPQGFLSWKAMIEAGKSIADDTVDSIAERLKSTDVINIQYTSGTTGFPKAAMLTHRNILMNGWYVTGCQDITENDRMCVPVPFYHCFGCVMGSIGAVTRGAAMIVPAEYFNPAATLEAVEKYACTTLYGVPTMFVALLEELHRHPRKLSALRSGIMAGSPCPIEIMKKVVGEMGCSEITIAYGQTELSPVVTQSRTNDSMQTRVETVGAPLPDIEIEIRDPVTDQRVADGMQGELCARGHGVMRGYYNNQAATELVLDKEGWIHSGDLAIRRPDGCYRITGRLKDMVIRGGENIYPREIEEFLFTHPAISQASVFGVPDCKYGEEICAWIHLHPGSTLNEEDIREFCKSNLAHYKVPRYIQFVDEFPTTVSGKIQKFKMREAMCETLNLKELDTA